MSHRPLCLCLAWALLASTAAAADFSSITAEERSLTAVPGEPNAPAVVLFKKGDLRTMGFAGEGSSSLVIEGRIKILTEEGKGNGEIAIYHSELAQLEGFEGRTVAPDGTILPVPADAKFVRKQSRSEKRYVTAVAFPAVQVGAVLDYRYEMKLESPLYLEPWYFSDDLPVLYSEIVYRLPVGVLAKTWSRGASGVKLKSDTWASEIGTVLTVWGRSFPAVPDDPFGPPFVDLASQIMLLPTSYSTGSKRRPLFESWAATCELFAKGYDKARRSDSGVAKKAKEVAAAGPVAEQAGRLFRFVRDEILTKGPDGVGLAKGASVGKALAERRGDNAEKALLLQTMLQAVKIDARLVWAAHRRHGKADLRLAHPRWFDTVLVLIELDGKRTFLDPADSAAAFGHLGPGFEGTPALIFDAENPEEIVLPVTPFDANVRRAEIDWTLDAAGRLTGTGTLHLAGQQAWRRIDWQDDEAATVKAWTEWLGERFKEFRLGEVKVAEIPDERRVTLSWTLSQREEEVLGDEASLVPSAPVGPVKQLFVQAAGARKTPVLFDFPDRDEVRLTVRWPEGWKIAERPGPAALSNPAGELAAEVEVREAERLLVYNRRFDLIQQVFASPAEYEAVRSLFAATEKSDAETLLLVRR